jgi:lysophospholipase L1-like esterase
MKFMALFALLVCGTSALHVEMDKSELVKVGQTWSSDDTTPKPRSKTMHNTEWKGVAQKRAQSVHALQNASILFYGDSIVEHWSGESQGKIMSEHNARPKLWQKYFVDRYGPSLASGIGGDRIRNLLWRLENGESPKDAQPRVIMLHIGTNDLSFGWYQSSKKDVPYDQMAEKFFAGYKAVVEKLDKESPHSTIVLTGIFPRHAEYPKGPYKQMIPHMNKLIASLADDSTIYFSDCSSAMLKEGKISQEFTKDFLHPTLEGAKRWAECLQPTLDKILLK